MYLGWCGEWAGQIRRVLKSNGSFFLNIGAAPSNPMLPHEIVMTFREFFVLQNTIHWIKSIAIDDHCSRRAAGDARASHRPSRSFGAASREAATAISSFGHFKPINSRRFLNDCHEYVFHFTKSGRVKLNRLAPACRIRIRATSRVGRILGNRSALSWEHVVRPYETIQNREKERPHPATFRFNSSNGVSNCTERRASGRCLILFSASEIPGSQRRAVDQKICRIEIDEAYLAEAKRRIAKGRDARYRK